MIVTSCDAFIHIGIHVLGDGPARERGRLPDPFVEESAAGIEDSTIETVEVDLLDQLAFVPVFFIFRSGALFEPGLHLLAFRIPAFE